LGKENADEMLTAMVGNAVEIRPLKLMIIERTQGNPFFMEETVLVLLDEGALVRNGTAKLTRPLNQLKIPPTVQAILAARIDRLSADQKDLLQTLAVIAPSSNSVWCVNSPQSRDRSWNRCYRNCSSASSSTSSLR
jgi:predicted ATPase